MSPITAASRTPGCWVRTASTSAGTTLAPPGDDLVHAPGGQEQVTVRIDAADVAPHSSFLSADALDPARVFSWQRIDFGTSDVVTLMTTNSGILTENLKADDSVDA